MEVSLEHSYGRLHIVQNTPSLPREIRNHMIWAQGPPPFNSFIFNDKHTLIRNLALKFFRARSKVTRRAIVAGLFIIIAAGLLFSNFKKRQHFNGHVSDLNG